MKRILKLTIICLLIIASIVGILLCIDIDSTKKVYAAGGNSASDLQLMARAINGEARGEPYEGQVAVRSSYLKPCEKF